MSRRVRRLVMESGYMDPVHDPDALIRHARKYIPSPLSFDTMIGTGLSGALAVPTLARAFGVDYLIVRKPDDGTHSNYPCEGAIGRRWLFVDDFQESGATECRVVQAVADLSDRHDWDTEQVGSYFYTNHGLRAFDIC